MERWLREREGDLLAHIEDSLRNGDFEMDALYNKAVEVKGIDVCVYRGTHAGCIGRIIEVGARDGGMHHGCVKIRFTVADPSWHSNEQWFLSGYVAEIREV